MLTLKKNGLFDITTIYNIPTKQATAKIN